MVATWLVDSCKIHCKLTLWVIYALVSCTQDAAAVNKSVASSGSMVMSGGAQMAPPSLGQQYFTHIEVYRHMPAHALHLYMLCATCFCACRLHVISWSACLCAVHDAVCESCDFQSAPMHPYWFLAIQQCDAASYARRWQVLLPCYQLGSCLSARLVQS